MNKVNCFLDISNNYAVGVTTIGKMIEKTNRQHLWEQRSNSVIDTVVLHYISASAKHPQNPFSPEAVLQIFPEYGVSSHYLIDRAGTVYCLVPEDKKAWHCGGSIMPEPDSRTGVNEFSIGIELIASSVSGYTEEQYLSLGSLCCDITARHSITAFTGHQDIAGARAVAMGLRSDLKEDPGEKFDWFKFHKIRLEHIKC